MSERNIIVRLETQADYRNVENLTREAFWNVYRPGCLEHYVLHCFRMRHRFRRRRKDGFRGSCFS
jgi:putative acetyltransferase